MKKLLLLCVVVLMLSMVSVSAATLKGNESMLQFNDVEVEVDGDKDKNLKDGDRISDEAKPGVDAEFKIEMKNIYPSGGQEIEDIEIEVTIRDIDDGDDLDDEADRFDLRPGRDDSETIKFEIPLEVGDGDYTVHIFVQGDDKNGNNTHEIEMFLILEVDKDRNQVVFTRASTSPQEVKCNRNVQASLTVLNIGEDDEEDVELTLTNAELGVDFREVFDLDEGEFDDDMKFSKTFSFNVGDNVAPGFYQLTSKVVFDEGDEVETETMDLMVRECDLASSKDDEEEEAPRMVEEETKKDDATTVVIQQPSTPLDTITADVIQPPTTSLSVEEDSLLDSPVFITSIIVLEVIVVLVGIALVSTLMRRRN